MFAKTARTRRDNLHNSMSDLVQQKERAEAELMDAETELQKAEKLEVREARQSIEQSEPTYNKHAMIG